MNVSQNTLLNLAGTLIPILVALLTIPPLISGLGQEKFSLLLLMFAIVGYMSLFDMGVGRALTYEISKRQNSPDDEIGSFIKAGLIIVLASTFLGVVFVLFFALKILPNWYDLNAEIFRDAQSAFLIISICILPTTITAGLRGALEGLNRFLQSNINRAFIGISIFSLPYISYKFIGDSLTPIAILLLIARSLVMLMALWQLYDKLATKTSDIIGKAKTLFSYGIWVAMASMIGPFMIYGDRFMLGGIIDVESVTYYATPQEFLVKLLIIPGAFASALFHNFSTNANKRKFLIDQSAKYKKLILLIMIPLVLILSLASNFLLEFWLGKDFAEKAHIPTIIMLIGVVWNSVSLVSFTTLSSLKYVRFITLIRVIELLIFVFTFWILTNNFGIIGAAIAWSTRTFIDMVILWIGERYALSKQPIPNTISNN